MDVKWISHDFLTVHVKLYASDIIACVRNSHIFNGFKNVKITQIYTHVLNRGGRGVRSPIDGG